VTIELVQHRQQCSIGWMYNCHNKNPEKKTEFFPNVPILKKKISLNRGNLDKNVFFSKFCMILSVCATNARPLHVFHWEEPPQNSNKSVKKMFFFHGSFDMVGNRIEKSLIWCLYLAKKKRLDAFLAKIEASDQRFFEDSYSFTWERSSQSTGQ